MATETTNINLPHKNRHIWFILLCMTIAIMTSGYVMALIRSVMLDTTRMAYQEYRAAATETTNENMGSQLMGKLSKMYVSLSEYGESLLSKRNNTLDKMTVIKEDESLFTEMIVPTDNPVLTPTGAKSQIDSDTITQGFNLTGAIDVSKNATAKKILDVAKTSGETALNVSTDGTTTFADLAKSEEYLRTKGTSYANVEMITIFFDSSTPSAIGAEQGRTNAKKIMDTALARLKSGEVTMKSLGQELGQSKAVQEIDPGYAQNTYIAYDFLKPTDSFVEDTAIQDLIWSLPVGSYSDVLTGKSFLDQKKSESYDSFYAIVHVSDRQKKSSDSIDELLEK
jgi:hypothetical protein